MQSLIPQIKQCCLCENKLPYSPNPILQVSQHSKILILGQAPGKVTHQKSIPFDDKSGDRLRDWLGVSRTQFYNDELFAILPLSFCYPGKGKSGDLPPLTACAQTWHEPILAKLHKVELTIILGKYASEWHLKTKEPITSLAKQGLTFLTMNKIVLPHPSPRNNIWLKKHVWFKNEVIPLLQGHIKSIIT